VHNDETKGKKAKINWEHLDTVNHIIINFRNTQKMLKDLLDAMLDIFNCDRAWLVHPCDPCADFFTVKVESTRPGYPGLGASDKKIPMTLEMSESMKSVTGADKPVLYDTKSGFGIPDWMADEYQIKSAIRMAVYPKFDQAWLLGMHRCKSDRPWTNEEKMLFNSIGRRLSDGLNAILLIRELKKANKTLMESEDSLAKIFHSSPMGIVILKPEKLEILNVNQSFLNTTGFDQEQVLGKDFLGEDFFIVPETMIILAGLKKKGAFSQVDIKFYNKQGLVRDGRLSSQRVNISGKQRIQITIEDITDYKKVEKEKLAAQCHAAEQEKYALIGQVAGKMAHDFNNILGAIMGNAELSLLDCKDPEAAKTFELILDQTKKGRNLTKNLVAFARDQEPKQDFFNINEKISLVLNLLKKDLKGIHIISYFSASMPELLADPGMIENALVNIFHNSIHAMGNEENPVLKILTLSDDDNILIKIEDNGCGIPKEHQRSVYAPAFTLKNSKDVLNAYDKSVKGTGYGLFNVKKIIQKHKGRIWFESKVNKGTKFFISLPVIKKDLTKKEKTELEKAILHKAKKILIVEDEQSISDVQSLILADKPFFHIVDVAHNGDMAMEFLKTHTYDLISLDYRLPGGLNGMDLYKTIRKKDTRIPIVFISGNIEFLESIIALKKKDKRLDHLSKPCQNKEYVDCINHLFGSIEI